MSSKTKLLVDADDSHGGEGRQLEVRKSMPGPQAATTHNENGLSSAEAQVLFAEHGPNEITEVKKHWFLKLLTYFVGPIPFLMEIATLISLVLFIYEESEKAADADPATWVVLGVLLLVNGLMGFKEESSAGDAIEALKASLAPMARCKRDGRLLDLPSRELVPGDLIILKGGDIVPADSKLHEGEPMEVDQAALTGESLPVTCFPGDVVYSGSVVKRGELHATVYATGAKTFFGKAAALVNSVNVRGHLQQVLLRVAYALMFTGIILVGILFVVLLAVQHQIWSSALVSCLVLLVASIPIAMQVVTTATMAVGARDLASNKAIVARLASIEELAGMTILCSDKTGTLTKNKLTLDTPTVFFGKEDDVIFSAALCAKWEGQDAIDLCLTNGVANQDFLFQHKQLKFIPFDPVNKRTESTILAPDGSQFKVTKGAPQVIAAMAHNRTDIAQRVDDVIEEFGQRGFRAIGVARTVESGLWEFQGLIPLFDPPRDDTKATIESALAMGVEVKMITGDHMTIAKETCRRLGMGTNIYTIDALESCGSDDLQGQMAENADGFAQVFPEHKFRIVEVLQKRGHLTGMTGDGVNDAPALKKADVGIAVEGATDAARAAADIVLTEPGLSVIIIAMTKAREIFLRMKAYVVYRIAATITLLLFMFFSQILLLSKPTPDSSIMDQGNWVGFPYPPSVHNLQHVYKGKCQDLPGNIGFCDAITSGDQKKLFPNPSDPDYPHFTLPAIVLVILTILNDGTILSIAYDRVVADKDPQQWRLLRVLGVCSVLGLLGFAECLIGFYVLSSEYITPIERTFSAAIGHVTEGTARFPLTPGQVEVCVYLFLSIGGQAIVFAARTSGPFFSRRPGNLLSCAFLFAQVTSILFALFWPFGGSLEGLAVNSFSTCVGVGPFLTLSTDIGKGIVLQGIQLYTATGKFSEVAGPSSVDATMTHNFCTGCGSSSSTCFLHATPNAWAVGFCLFWAIIWFLLMDFCKISVYRVYASQDAQDNRVERRRMQKRLSVAMDSERRGTMGAGGARRPPAPGSVQAAVAKQEHQAQVPPAMQRALTDLQSRMDALDKEQKELRSVIEEYLRTHP